MASLQSFCVPFICFNYTQVHDWGLNLHAVSPPSPWLHVCPCPVLCLHHRGHTPLYNSIMTQANKKITLCIISGKINKSLTRVSLTQWLHISYEENIPDRYIPELIYQKWAQKWERFSVCQKRTHCLGRGPSLWWLHGSVALVMGQRVTTLRFIWRTLAVNEVGRMLFPAVHGLITFRYCRMSLSVAC